MHFFIQHYLKEYRFNRQNVVQSKKIAILYICFCLAVWTLIIVWVVVNGGHVYKTNQVKTTTIMKVSKAFETNYSMKEFKQWVQPEEINNYNRIWNAEDYATILPDEVQVTTNLVITSNQTMSLCSENPRFNPGKCIPDLPYLKCTEGNTTAHGILTGRCIIADIQENDQATYTCEIRGLKYKGWYSKTHLYLYLKIHLDFSKKG